MNWTTGKDLVKLAKQWPAPTTIAVMLGLILFCAWAVRGGFARGGEFAEHIEEFTDLKAQIKAGRLEGLEGQMFEARVAQCRAESEELREMYAQRVSELQSDYRAAGGLEFALPRCSDL